MKKLAAVVNVMDPETREIVSYGPDDDVPEDVAALITNPAAWVDDGEDSVVAVEPASVLSDEEKDAALEVAFNVVAQNDLSKTRDELILIAANIGLVAGEDFNKSAGKETIIAAMKHKLDD